MEFKHFAPSDILKPYVECFYEFRSDRDVVFDDTVFPSGNMEIIFNLGGGTWESASADHYVKTPTIELWGQITKPLPIRSKGKHCMLGVKFLPHAASYFLNVEISELNNSITDVGDVLGNPIRVLHDQLFSTDEVTKRISLLENFLVKRLVAVDHKALRIEKVAHLLTSMKKLASDGNLNDVASQHGITTRYLQKLVFQHTGLSPKALAKINRFKHSLRLIARNDQPLTSVAYDCGYFDQSHFIREFKSFTSITPSAYLENRFPVNQAIFS
ncbi:helix-turn-helix transcriptional regulator [Chryseolinea lacunae]|uniref:Helix-turn-helix transcriptional regulator n=1 Tax=Chryseolinea lacunae TaxID=2801331 RepID=A0ABS1KMR0_9BACT|nr:helix-turn-helix transcriptional regulator [Chryseolinea lacunae]MBL0740763.1 helix-turn-helix transcriptional regulator [Chryseolinea lacunae]